MMHNRQTADSSGKRGFMTREREEQAGAAVGTMREQQRGKGQLAVSNVPDAC